MTKKKKSYYTVLLKACRREWTRHNLARKSCFAAAKVQTSDGLPKWMCAQCKVSFAQSDVDCDHILPVSNSTPQTQEEFELCTRKMNVLESGLQILCKPDHKAKTKCEAGERAKDKLINDISFYLGIPDESIRNKIEDVKVLKKLCNLIKKIEANIEPKKYSYVKKFDVLAKIYL